MSLVGVWVARYLGPSEYGQLSLVIAYLAFFQIITGLGFDNLVVRDLSKLHQDDNITFSNKKTGEIIGTVIAMRAFSGLVSWIIAIGIMAIFSDHKSTLLTFVLGGILIFQSADTFDLWFQSQSKSRLTVISKIIAIIIVSGLRIIFIILELPLIYFAIAILLEAALTALALLFAYSRSKLDMRLTDNIKNVGWKLLKESWPYLLSGISIITYMRIDQLIINSIMGKIELGIYSAIIPLATTWYFIPMILSVSLMPVMAKKRAIGKNEFLKIFRIVYFSYLFISLLISIFIASTASIIVHYLFGVDFEGGVNALRIYALSIIPVSLGFAYNLFLVNEGKSINALYRTIIGALVTAIFSWYFITRYGLIGASMGGLLGYVASDILMPLFLDKSLFYSLFYKLKDKKQ